MRVQIRVMMGAALLALVVAGCGDGPVAQPAEPSFGKNSGTGGTLPGDDSVHTGYFGSGHNSPPDTMNATPPG
jgi:hypothetical protein